jgi:hypothetical protein
VGVEGPRARGLGKGGWGTRLVREHKGEGTVAAGGSDRAGRWDANWRGAERRALAAEFGEGLPGGGGRVQRFGSGWA